MEVVMRFLFLTLFVLLYLGCGSAAGSDTGPLTDEAYFSIRRDARACVSPLCGGFFVSELNVSATVCADNSTRSECYVAELVSDNPRISGNANQLGNALVKGKILSKTFEGFGNLGQISVSEAWVQFLPP
jgi:hypothetical protein